MLLTTVLQGAEPALRGAYPSRRAPTHPQAWPFAGWRPRGGALSPRGVSSASGRSPGLKRLDLSKLLHGGTKRSRSRAAGLGAGCGPPRGVAECSLPVHTVVHETPARRGGAAWSFRERAREAKHRLLTHALPISPERLRCSTKRGCSRTAHSGRNLAPLGACQGAEHRLPT